MPGRKSRKAISMQHTDSADAGRPLSQSEGRVTVGDKKESVGQNSIVPSHYPYNESEQPCRITTCKQYGKPGNDYVSNHHYP